jgi:hypothetical protein
MTRDGDAEEDQFQPANLDIQTHPFISCPLREDLDSDDLRGAAEHNSTRSFAFLAKSWMVSSDASLPKELARLKPLPTSPAIQQRNTLNAMGRNPGEAAWPPA